MNIEYANENIINNVSKTKGSVREKYEVKARYIKVKRAIDCILSIMALIMLSPIYLIIALAVKIDSPGPVFFKHTRIGKNGKTIKIYKFRSMVMNAEELIKTFTPEQMKEYKENYKNWKPLALKYLQEYKSGTLDAKTFEKWLKYASDEKIKSKLKTIDEFKD